jgi:4-amino-4-deoxy-L-arabinose transferase-like glycosyltransferase
VQPDALESPPRRTLLGGPRSARARAPGSVAVVSVLDATPVRPRFDRSQPHPGVELPLGERTVQRGRLLRRSLLPAVLGVQAALSLRLVWSNTAFQDEALYLRAGHLEWAHWLHGVPIPDFPSYFSGAPVIYPPIGALADSLGGLVAARALSLCCMLGVTALLWATTRRLYGLRAALLAAGLFATLAGTQFLGAFATFDAMALLLLAFAVWLGVRAADCQLLLGRVMLLCACGLMVAAADATKYATVLFTPVVLAAVGLAAWRRRQKAWPSVAALAVVASSWLSAVGAAVILAGPLYLTGIRTSTLDRSPGNATVAQVLEHSYIWTSLILILAALGALLAVRSSERGRMLPAVLAFAAVLVPVAQLHLHTTVSLQKHVVFGAWFAAIAAGYALARLSRVDPGVGWAPVMALPIVASTLFGSIGQADALFRVWPNSAGVISVLDSAVRAHPGNVLAEDFDVEAYYLRTEVPWQRWSSTYYFSYPDAGVGPSAFETAISQHYFSLVILQFGDTAATDRQIVADMARAGGYYVLAKAGPFTIWAAQAPQSVAGSLR